MSFREFITLFPLACANLFSTLWQKIGEGIHFGWHLWWWKLQALMAALYFFDPPYRIVSRFPSRPEFPRDNLIYGETPLLTFQSIMGKLSLQGGEMFCDLGCGRGFPCFFAHYLLKMPAVGIDLIPEFIDRANRIKGFLHARDLTFLKSSFIEADLPAGAIFYCAGTTFDDATMLALSEKLLAIPGRIIIISLSRGLPSPLFETIHCGLYRFSWGTSHVYIQEKVRTFPP
jgi:hypothetical protein